MMPIQVVCPRCRVKYSVAAPPPKGRQFRCGKCNAAFVPKGPVKVLSAAGPSAVPSPAPSPPAEEELVGRTLGGCRIVRKLRDGGAGAVYQAQHLALDIPVAVKVLSPRIAASRPAFAEQFLRDARAAARIQHQNVVGVLNAGEEGGLRYIVMQYVDGESLREKINAQGRLAVREATAILRQMCEALAAGRAKEIIHRDIRPAHIFIAPHGIARLADLGLSRNLEEDAGLPVTAGGSIAAYMAPEQAADPRRADHRSDIYSLGCVLFETLTGRTPGNGATPDIRTLNPQVPEHLAAVLRRMLAPRPEDRYQRAEDVLADLDKPGGATPAEKPSPWSRVLRRWFDRQV